MRMWMLPPEYLCRNHLLGNHNEIHKHKHNFEKQHSIHGRIYPIVLIEPESMKTYHDKLAEEMLRRGYNHQSPYEMPVLSYLPDDERYAKVDLEYNLKDLMNRCENCKTRILEKNIV